jgi:putative transposase
LIRRRGPWRNLDHVEIETLEWVNWFNRRRLHSACGDVPPAEFEEQYYRHNRGPEKVEAEQLSLH